MKRFVSVWFPHLLTNWMARRNSVLKDADFVLAAPEGGRMVIKAVSETAQAKGIVAGMVVADARSLLPALQVFDYEHGTTERLLRALAEWCIRYTPTAAIDLPDGITLDASGCAHLWEGEPGYLKDIYTRLTAFGYSVRMAMADTIAAAWALCHYGPKVSIVPRAQQLQKILPLPPAALRLDSTVLERMEKLGFHHLSAIIHMPRTALRRRFGPHVLLRIDQALGHTMEMIDPVCPVEPYQERLPCLEPIRTRAGIEIALENLLRGLCCRLDKEQLGVRSAFLRCYRIDGHIQQLDIGTHKPSRNTVHLFKLFSLKLGTLAPGLGFELFVLEAKTIEPLSAAQEALWDTSGHHDDVLIAELIDRINGKIGSNTVQNFLPAEHYWPERAYRPAASPTEKPATGWRTDLPRPLCLLAAPERIEVTVPLPDYPPMLFRHKGQLHEVKRADGPERIEQEWWLQEGEYRDYYCLEDKDGQRYWVFRLGDYQNNEPHWFLHGLFA